MLSYREISLRIILGVLLSGVIGMEREKNQSNAGIKTHAIVGLSSTSVAIFQQLLVFYTLQQAQSYPEMAHIFRSDSGRIIAQVISGIGFLGAGTIVVTSRSITGLTTAASIWSVAVLGMIIGSGFYFVAIALFLALIFILFVSKRLVADTLPKQLKITYLASNSSHQQVHQMLKNLPFDTRLIHHESKLYQQDIIYIDTYRISGRLDEDYFEQIFEELSQTSSIISIESTDF